MLNENYFEGMDPEFAASLKKVIEDDSKQDNGTLAFLKGINFNPLNLTRLCAEITSAKIRNIISFNN